MQPGYYTALFYSVVLHGLLLGFLAVSFGWQQFTAASVPPPLAIQAAVVDEELIAAELEKLAAADERIRVAEAQRQRELDEQAAKARAEREREEQRLAELERQRVAAEQRQREQQQQREQAEQERKSREQQAAAERKAREEAEKQRLAELEAERVREEKRLAALAEKRRKEEAARREAALQAEREEQLRREMAEERARMDAVDSGLKAEYITLIEQRIVRNWNRPPSAQPGLNCVLNVRQIPGGEVVDVKVVKCNGDAVVVRSIEAAVYKASPLPQPPDPRLFEREVELIFVPEN